MPPLKSACSAEIVRPDWRQTRKPDMHSPGAPCGAEIIRPAWPRRGSPTPERSPSFLFIILLSIALILPLVGAADAQQKEAAPAGNAPANDATAETGSGAEMSAAHAPQDEEPRTSVDGAVRDVFGNMFVLDTGDEHLLVTTGPDWYHRLEVRVGEQVTVTGERDEEGFDAFKIVRGDGTAMDIRPFDAPPAWAEGHKGPPWAEDRKGPPWAEHRKGPPWAEDRKGPPWAEGRKGPPWAEGRQSMRGRHGGDERDSRKEAGGRPGQDRAPKMSERDLAHLMDDASYEYLGDAKHRGNHVDLVARNPEGEIVEVRINSDGEIVRERRLLGRR